MKKEPDSGLEKMDIHEKSETSSAPAPMGDNTASSTTAITTPPDAEAKAKGPLIK